jgi:hypothetical protein
VSDSGRDGYCNQCLSAAIAEGGEGALDHRSLGLARCSQFSLLLPLLLQSPQEMARTVGIVLKLTDCLSVAVRPGAMLREFSAGQVLGLPFALPLRMTGEVVKLGHETGPLLSATRPQSVRTGWRSPPILPLFPWPQ